MFTAAGKSAAVSAANYIEDVFSTWLYTGNGSTQTITNGIDLSTKGGLVWLKGRSVGYNNGLFDTVRGADFLLCSNNTDPSTSVSGIPASAWITGFNSNGFGLGSNGSANNNGTTYVSWTFREQAKFFDVVTYTGNGASSQAISHALGSTPGCVIVKRTDSTSFWLVWHRGFSSPSVSYGYLNTTDPFQSDSPNNNWAAAPTSTTFTPASNFNANGATYVAYLFAHNAGGFGATGTDNVISCGSFTSATSTINLGYEPQFILFKASNGTGNWRLVDNMRGLPASGNPQELYPNLSQAETSNGGVNITSTGFTQQMNDFTYIYIAIRRGPMKTPTSGTSVFSPNVPTGFTQFTTGFPVDLGMWFYQPGYSENTVVNDRLRGVSSTNSVTNANNLVTSSTAAEAASQGTRNWNNTGLYAVTSQAVFYSFRRAPGFFDVVCYTGTGSATTFNHNLTVVPELMIVKSRNNATNWAVYCAYLGGANPANRYVLLNSSNGFGGTAVYWNDTAPTSTVFTVGTTASTNTSSYTYVNYLFATVAGVSKVGSYTGTGALQTVNCGFASGARFVLIKRTDSTGDWWVYDSARGITSGNDPYLFLNSTAAEVTNTNYVDTASTGFQVTAAAPAGLNANGGTYIFLAIS